MNTVISGAREQAVTTWGSDARDGRIVPGSERPIKTALTCRCGQRLEYRGFWAAQEHERVGWRCFQGEWFCGLACAVKTAANVVRAQVAELEEAKRKLDSECTSLWEALRMVACVLCLLLCACNESATKPDPSPPSPALRGELVGPPIPLRSWPTPAEPPECAKLRQERATLAAACDLEITKANNDCDAHDYCPNCDALAKKRAEFEKAGCR